jgi:hypothetical protein
LSDAIKAINRASFWIGCRVNDAGYTGANESTSAHHAGFEGNVSGRVLQTPAAESNRCGAKCHNFCVCSRIAILLPQIVAGTEHSAVASDNHAAHGDIAVSRRRIGFGKR